MSEDGYDTAVTLEETGMELSIETLTGTTFEMTVSPTDSILDIKNKIQRVEGIPIHQQHLLYKLQELQDDDRLCDKGITEGATLRLVLSMRGGPVSTRRQQLSEHHIAWKEIKEFVESTKDNLTDKLPAGSKVTVLLFREGDTINLFRVIENENGTYSPIPCEVSQRVPKTSGKKEDSHTSIFKRFLENSEMLNKVTDLRRRMGDLSLKRQMKNSQPVVDQEVDNCSRVTDLNQPSTSGYVGQRRRERISYPHRHSHSTEKTLSEKYSDRILSMIARREAQAKAAAHARTRRPHRLPAFVSGEIVVNNEHDSDEDLVVPTDYASPESVAASMSTPEDKDALSANTVDKKIRRISTAKIPSGSGTGVQLYVVQNPGDHQRPKTAPQKFDHHHQPDICDMVLNDQSELCNNGGGGAGVKVGMINRRPSLDYDNLAAHHHHHHHLEYAEANLETDNGSSSSVLTAASNPDVSGPQWSLKCLQMQPCFVSTATASAIPPQYAPKDEPVIEEEAEERIYMNVKLPATEQLHRHPRYPLYGRKSSRQSNIERIRNDTSRDVGTITDGDGYACCSYEYAATDVSEKNSSLDATEVKRSVRSYVDNIERISDTTNYLQEFAIERKSQNSQNSTSKSSISERGNAKSSINIIKSSSTKSIDILPPVVTKKRIRCGQCNKRLNITNVYNCPCGGIFCSQHRYSEVHGCHYDYKTEGRKMIEKANPLVTACKLPKI